MDLWPKEYKNNKYDVLTTIEVLDLWQKEYTSHKDAVLNT